MAVTDEGRAGLAGSMIPRATRRLYDERGEERYHGIVDDAVLTVQGRDKLVRVVNISSEGAMVTPASAQRIGEPVILRLPGEIQIPGSVRWIRDGRMGINFSTPLRIETAD